MLTITNDYIANDGWGAIIQPLLWGLHLKIELTTKKVPFRLSREMLKSGMKRWFDVGKPWTILRIFYSAIISVLMAGRTQLRNSLPLTVIRNMFWQTDAGEPQCLSQSNNASKKTGCQIQIFGGGGLPEGHDPGCGPLLYSSSTNPFVHISGPSSCPRCSTETTNDIVAAAPSCYRRHCLICFCFVCLVWFSRHAQWCNINKLTIQGLAY